MTDIYSAPQAPLASEKAANEYGSVAKALAGDYTVAIGDTISEAWQRTKGNKGKICLALLLCMVSYLVIQFIIGGIITFAFLNPEGGLLTLILISLFTNLLMTLTFSPMVVGLMMMGIKIARNEAASAAEVFAHYDKIVPLFLCVFLINLLSSIGFLFFILPGIYLVIAYMMSTLLMADKKMGIWQAMETSRKAISKHWFVFLGFNLVFVLLSLAGALVLLIGLIWAVPTVVITYGIIYRNMFGGPDADAKAEV